MAFESDVAQERWAACHGDERRGDGPWFAVVVAPARTIASGRKDK